MPDAGSALDRPFVQELLRRVRPVASRRLGVALALVGTAGSGKTWSARELVRRAPCASLEVRGARVAVELARGLARLGGPPWAMSTLERAVAGEPVGPEPLSEAIAGVLAAATPILVLVDDAHEADPGGAELLERLARRIHRMPGVALVLTSRGEAPAAATKVDVPPLDEAETRNVVTALLEAEPPEQAVSWTHRHAHGNPLFTIEYVRLLAQAGYLWNDLERWRWRPAPDGLLPVTVEGVLERRIADAGLLPAERAALEALALLHETGVADAWAQTAGLSERALGAAALGLERHGLVRAAEFRHPLLAQVVVRTTPPTRRREHARRAVEVLRAHAPEAVAAVALAAALDAAETVDLLGRAAEAARERGDARTAASWWSRAAERADGPQRARFASLAGRALLAVDPEASVPHLEAAFRAAPDDAELPWLLAEAHARAGRREAMREALRRAAPEADARAAWRELHLLFVAGALDEVLELWRRRLDGLPLEPGAAVYDVAYALMDRGELGAAMALAERGLATFDAPVDRAGLLEICAAVHHYRGEYAVADELFAGALAAFEAVPDAAPTSTANVRRNRALNRLFSGAYRETLPDFAAALAAYAAAGDSVRYAQTLVMVSEVHGELGDVASARAALLEALSVFERIEPQPFLMNAYAGLATLYLGERDGDDGRPRRALALARAYAERASATAAALANPVKVAHADVVMARVLARDGEAARALQLAARAEASADAMGFREIAVHARWARGAALAALGRSAAAAEALRAAAALAAADGMAVEAHRLEAERAELEGDDEARLAARAWLEARGLHTGPDAPQGGSTGDGAGKGARVRLDVLGPMRVALGARRIAVRGRQRRRLLALLAEGRLEGRDEVPRDELLTGLYGERGAPDALRSLKQLVYQARRLLGDGAIRTTGNGYALVATTDAEAFLEDGEPVWWRGRYLEDVDDAWLGEVAGAVSAALARAVERLALAGAPEAVRLGRVLVDMEPYDVAALASLERALLAAGDVAGAETVHAAGRARLADVGDEPDGTMGDFLAGHPPRTDAV